MTSTAPVPNPGGEDNDPKAELAMVTVTSSNVSSTDSTAPSTNQLLDEGNTTSDKEKEDDKGKGKKKQGPGNMVPYSALFRYATRTDKILMVIGTICAAANGAVMPLYAILLGNLINSLANPSGVYDSVLPYSTYLFLLGIGSLIVAGLAYTTWSTTAQKQVKIVREEYLLSVLRQEIGWWDAQSPGELSSRLAADSDQIEAAIGTSVPACIQHVSRFFTGICVGFAYGWQLALVIIAISPVLIGMGAVMGKFMATMAGISAKAYGQAGAVAEEALTSMRTVTAFNAEKQELKRFDVKLQEALKAGEKRARATGALFGMIMFVMFSSYALSFWFGAQLIAWGSTNSRTGKAFTGGDVLSTFFGMLIGSFSLGQLAPYIPDFTNGRAAGYRIFQVITRISAIDGSSNAGATLNSVKGEIEFRNIEFAYPTRLDNPILKRINLKVLPGQTVALVGESGSGKSTCIGLVERFYDPIAGQVIVDGEHDLKSLNIRWWRQNVGLVGQMPILFHGTIRENIKYGKPTATEEEVINASKLANAHTFIDQLPEKYDTMLGGFGSEFLSGGQKQRIAIARALIKQPKILLLDEATSALDNESEKVVQKALDQLMRSETGKSMTCLVIAHRLSTVRDADNIFVFSKGDIVESGTHEQLIDIPHGMYSNLVRSQGAAAQNEEKEELKAELPLPSPKSERRKSVTKSKKSRRGSTSKSKKEPSRSHHFPLEPPMAQPAEPEHESEREEEVPEDEKDEEEVIKVPNSYLWGLIKPNFFWALLGTCASAGAGAVQPVFGLVMSSMITVFYKTNIEELKKDANTNALWFLLVAIGNFLMLFTQSYGLGLVGERMTTVLRYNVFRSLLRQEISFFDDGKNSAGVLATRLSVDSEQVRKITTDWAGQLLQVVVCSAGGLLIAYITNWRMALLLTGTAPFIVLSGLGHMLFMKAKGAKKAFEEAGSVASEAITGIHTVVSFTSEDIILKRFSSQLLIPLKAGIRSGAATGVALGGSELLLFVAYGCSLLYGAYLIDEKISNFQDVVRVFFCVVLSFQNIGRIAERTPDIHKSLKAIRAVYALISRKSAIDHEDTSGEEVDSAKGMISFKDVRFRYPSRPDAVVLQQFNLEIQSGKTTALVGFSGSGKSTVIQLLERFYDPEGGYVEVNGANLANLNVKNWRSLIGYVGQEPVLFNMTIKENLLYGKPSASEDELLDAARKANVMEFVSRLPLGLDTPVGSRGGQISGGQRQRVAIARALLRDPQILLLDEATSALDNESERLIQEALERLMKNRTTVVVAHRLSTIRNADSIVVMSQGRVVEVGNHDSLVNKENGVYAQLVAAGASSSKH